MRSMNTSASFFCTGTMPTAARLPSSGNDSPETSVAFREVDLEDAFAADDPERRERCHARSASRGVVHADPAIVALEHQELMVVQRDDRRQADVAALPRIAGGRGAAGRRMRLRMATCGSSW